MRKGKKEQNSKQQFIIYIFISPIHRNLLKCMIFLLYSISCGIWVRISSFSITGAYILSDIIIGVFDAVRIYKIGYPYHLLFKDFNDKTKMHRN